MRSKVRTHGGDYSDVASLKITTAVRIACPALLYGVRTVDPELPAACTCQQSSCHTLGHCGNGMKKCCDVRSQGDNSSAIATLMLESETVLKLCRASGGNDYGRMSTPGPKA